MSYEWARWVLDQMTGIQPYEVRQVLEEGRRWPRPAVGPHGERVLTIWGRTRAGRPLIVRIQPLGGWDWIILGAREMSAAKVAEFEKWEAQGMSAQHYEPVIVPQTPEQINEFMDNLTFTDEEVDPADVPPPLGPDEEIMVMVSLRVSVDVYRRLKALADRRGEKYTLMLRSWIELELADAEADGQRVTREDALRAVAVLHKLGFLAA